VDIRNKRACVLVESELSCPRCDMNQAPLKTQSTDVIHCIGDSHVSFFGGQDVIQPGWPVRSEDLLGCFVTHHLGGALAYNLTRTGTQMRGREKLFEVLEQAVPSGRTVLLSFGEIDCRAHVLKQAAQRKVATAAVVAECLEHYFQAVREVMARGFPVIVYNAVPSAIARARKSGRADDYVAVGDWRERNQAIREFNAGAKQRCADCGAKFLETFSSLVTAEGRAVGWYYFDAIHLSQRAMPLTLRALAGLFPERNYPQLPIVAPSAGAQVLDVVAKRVRRWVKLKPPRRPTVLRD
jgi:hypothetical protein